MLMDIQQRRGGKIFNLVLITAVFKPLLAIF